MHEKHGERGLYPSCEPARLSTHCRCIYFVNLLGSLLVEKQWAKVESLELVDRSSSESSMGGFVVSLGGSLVDLENDRMHTNAGQEKTPLDLARYTFSKTPQNSPKLPQTSLVLKTPKQHRPISGQFSFALHPSHDEKISHHRK